MSIFIIVTSYANPKFMRYLNSFKKWYINFKWKVIKVLFKNKLETQRLMIIANLLEKKDSYYKYMPQEDVESCYDVEREAFIDEEVVHYYEYLRFKNSNKNKNVKIY